MNDIPRLAAGQFIANHTLKRATISDVPEYLATEIQDWLTFANPKFGQIERLNHWNGATSKFLNFSEFTDNSDMSYRAVIHGSNLAS